MCKQREAFDEVFKLLKEVVEAPSVPGFCDAAREVIREHMKRYADKVETDVLGNVIGIIGKGELRVMFSAHMDQIGFMVRGIDKSGVIRFSPSGGWDSRIVFGSRVIIHTKKGPVLGVIAVKPVHLKGLFPEEFKKVIEIHNMVIDIGATNEKEAKEMGVEIGDPITLYAPVERMKNEQLAIGGGFDDKAGGVTMLLAMKEFSESGIPDDISVYFVASTQEELGARGARVATYRINPKVGVAIDVTHAKSPVVGERFVTIELGKGPAIGIGPNFHRLVWETLIKAAKEENIPYQIEPISGPSGTDAWVIQVTREGVYTGLISLPLKYMHTGIEMISLEDVANIGKLIAGFVKRIDKSVFV